VTAALDLTRRNLLRNIATLFSGSVVAQGMTALALLLTARQLGADGYGPYAACIALASIAAILFSLGLDIWLLREGGRSALPLAELAGSVLAIKVAFGLGWMALFFVLAPLLQPDTYPAGLMRWSLLVVWLDVLLATVLTSFKAALRSRTPALLEAGADLIWFLATLALIGLGLRQPERYFQIRALVSAPALLLGVWLLRRAVGLRFSLSTARLALRQCFPFALADLLGTITMRADLVIVGWALGKTAAGVYSPAVGLVNMVFLAPMAVHTVMVPVLSNLYRNHPAQARRSAGRTVLLLTVMGVALTAAFAAVAPLLVRILGPSYQGSLGILRIISLVLLFKSLSFGMAAIIVATDQQAQRTAVQAVAALANILLNLLVVSRWGVQGVAGVYVLTEVILLAGYTWIAWRKR